MMADIPTTDERINMGGKKLRAGVLTGFCSCAFVSIRG
jgi:hypothetical protein